MKELIYRVEFLSDIVLPASSNTEGNIEQLDFIAGSNFLGMVAQKYDAFENKFDVFHSGKVRFEDATMLHADKPTYKVPLSYFHKKMDTQTIYNHHLINPSDYEQLKQLRNGYITEDKTLLHVEYNYAQKSAYDNDKRKSKDSTMFGYSSMKKGLVWQFRIKIDEGISAKDEELINSTILNSTRLGKSKSAQYGLVKITKEDRVALNSLKSDINSNEIVLYANSRLSLVDESGNPTYDLKYLFDGLEDDNIVYEKSQIKTSSFTPYNRARQTKDYERVCINKGSVIVLKDIELKDIPSFVGVYQSEGFGEILVNPSFLAEEKFSFAKDSDPQESTIKTQPSTNLAMFLQQRESKKQDRLSVLNKVDVFIKDNTPLYKNLKSSQWGKIRSICTSGGDNFKDEIRKYISHGAKKWEDKQIDTFLQDDYSLEFIKLISIQLPKVVKNEN